MTDGARAIVNIVSSQTKLPLIDPRGDSGRFLGPVLTEPETCQKSLVSCRKTLLRRGDYANHE